MTNKELFALYSDLMGIQPNGQKGKSKLDDLSGDKLTYCISKNLRLINKKLVELRNTFPHNKLKKYYEYESKLREIQIKYNIPQDLRITGSMSNEEAEEKQIKIKEISDKRIKAENELREEYKKDIEFYSKVMEKWQKLLDQETDIKFFKVKRSQIICDINQEQMNLIFDFIIDDIDESKISVEFAKKLLSLLDDEKLRDKLFELWNVGGYIDLKENVEEKIIIN